MSKAEKCSFADDGRTKSLSLGEQSASSVQGQWTRYKLRQVCTLINGRAYNKSELLDEGKYPVLRVGNFFTNNHWYYSDMELAPDKYCDDGDLLYAWSASFGPRIWAGERVIFHYHIWKVLPNAELIDKRFLLLWFLWDADRIRADQGTGTTMMHVAKGSMEDRGILLPSLSEQERIVAILDEAFEGIATAETTANKNKANAFELFESRVSEIFTARGDGWQQQKLEEVCQDITVGHVGSMSNEYQAEGVPFLRSQNVRPFHISLENVVYINEVFNNSLKKSQLRPGDLAIVRTGYPGTAAVIPADLPLSNCSDLVIVRPGPRLNPYYMAHFFNSTHGKRLVLGNIVGSAQKHFNIGSAKNVSVPVPSLTQQERVVAMLDEFRQETQRLETAQTQKLHSLETLKQSLLHQAFSGNL